MQIYTEVSFENISEEEWDALAQKSSTNTIFQTYQWNKTWWDIFGSNKSLLLICAKEGGKLSAVLPLVVVKKAQRRVLKFIGFGHSDYVDFIYPSDDEGLLDKLLSYLSDHKDSWDQMTLDYVPSQSKTNQCLERFCVSHKLYFHNYAKSFSPTLIIEDDKRGLDLALKKKSLKKYHQYFVKKDGYEVKHLTQQKDIEPFLDDFFAQHVNRRSMTEAPSLFLNDKNKDFYRNLLLNLCPHKRVLFSYVKSQGKPIAFHFGFIYNDRFLYYKPTFDIKLASRSPGKVLLRELLEHALVSNYKEFDFSLGKEAYKLEFCNQMKECYSYKILKTGIDYWMSRAISLARRSSA